MLFKVILNMLILCLKILVEIEIDRFHYVTALQINRIDPMGWIIYMHAYIKFWNLL